MSGLCAIKMPGQCEYIKFERIYDPFCGLNESEVY